LGVFGEEDARYSHIRIIGGVHETPPPNDGDKWLLFDINIP